MPCESPLISQNARKPRLRTSSVLRRPRRHQTLLWLAFAPWWSTDRARSGANPTPYVSGPQSQTLCDLRAEGSRKLCVELTKVLSLAICGILSGLVKRPKRPQGTVRHPWRNRGVQGTRSDARTVGAPEGRFRRAPVFCVTTAALNPGPWATDLSRAPGLHGAAGTRHNRTSVPVTFSVFSGVQSPIPNRWETMREPGFNSRSSLGRSRSLIEDSR
jgi:hypothetical protein